MTILNSFTNSKKSQFWMIFHVILGVLSPISPLIIIIWFYVVFFTSIFFVINQLGKQNYTPFMFLLFYLASFEMLGRMAKANPFIPTELGKYMLILFFVAALLVKGPRSKAGITMILLLLPSLLYDLSGKVVFQDIVYNIFGPIALAMGIAVLYRVPIYQHHYEQLLRIIWLTSVSALVFSFIETPDLSDVYFSLTANFETSAGISSNQVATVLGLGMFLSMYAVINRLCFSGWYLVDIFFTLLFAFQGLLTFSRGGMLISGLGIGIILIEKLTLRTRFSNAKLIIGSLTAALGLFLIIKFTNNLTDGKLFLRYQGETEGTILGSKEKSADVLVSGRLTIFSEDIDLWWNHPIVGVGASASRYLRDKTVMVSPHIELSRLLAEHGVLGLLFFLLLFHVYRKVYKGMHHDLSKGIFIALFVIAITTTFHAAMRTYVTPVLFFLAIIVVIPNSQSQGKLQ